MFLLVQRTDTLPEMRVIVNTDQVVAVIPVTGGVKTKLYLVNGETWEIAMPFARATSVFSAQSEAQNG